MPLLHYSINSGCNGHNCQVLPFSSVHSDMFIAFYFHSVTSMIWQIFFSLFITRSVILAWIRSSTWISKFQRIFKNFLRKILICAYTIGLHHQLLVVCTIPSRQPFPTLSCLFLNFFSAHMILWQVLTLNNYWYSQWVFNLWQTDVFH